MRLMQMPMKKETNLKENYTNHKFVNRFCVTNENEK